MDPHDQITWAREKNHQLGDALNQYLIGNRPLVDCLIEVVGDLYPLRDITPILRFIEDREEDLETGELVSDWGTWLMDLTKQIQALSPGAPEPKGSTPNLPAPKETKTSDAILVGDVLVDYVDHPAGEPQYGLLGKSYFPRASGNIKLVRVQSAVADPRKNPSSIISGSDYIHIPPMATISVLTMERIKFSAGMEILVIDHPAYAGIGVKVTTKVISHTVDQTSPLDIEVTNFNQKDAKFYIGHGFCELKFLRA